jgi:ubiquinone/menaquinone biosynthesis C-methylase UbiE
MGGNGAAFGAMLLLQANRNRSGVGVMAAGISNSELRKTWEAAAPGWAKWEKAFSANLDEVTDDLLHMAGVEPGARVLDVACGAGNQTIQAARRVGPTGMVVASDISATMLERVRQGAAGEGIENIETLECPVDEFDEAQAPFDAAICRLGLMLFPTPSRALRSVQRVLKPGARFAALVVTTPANNPYLSQPMRILLDHAGKQPPAPGQPGLFALGGDGVLEGLLKESGLENVETKTVRTPFRLASADDALEMMQQAFGAYRAVVADLGEDDRSRAWADVHGCLTQFEGANGFEAELELLIGVGAYRAGGS